MFILEAIQAKHGDCLLLRYGDGAAKNVIVIDGGPSGVYPRLRKRLEQLAGPGSLNIPICMVSHIDDDHINGIIDFFDDLDDDQVFKARLAPSTLWHNSLDDLLGRAATQALTANRSVLAGTARPLAGTARAPAAAVVASFAQGHELRDLANRLDIPVNFPGHGPVMAGLTVPAGSLERLELTVLSPDTGQVDRLRTKWTEWARTHRPDAVTAACRDRSIYNLSSIVVLAKWGAKRMLLTGDARGDHVVNALEAAGLLDGQGRIHVDLLKIPHHGSRNNSDQAFFERVVADHYVVSGDNDRHPENPNVEVLEDLRDARDTVMPARPYTVWMTYDHAPLRAVFRSDQVKGPQDGRCTVILEP